jgi:nitrous oxidase accessory protein
MRTPFFILSILFCTFSGAKTIWVQPGASIQEAINLAKTGDSIWVKPGTYYQHDIKVDKSISLFGQGKPTLDAQGKGEIITVTANSVLIEGFHFHRVGRSSMTDWAAVKVLNAQRVKVTHNWITKSYFGIYFSNSNHCSAQYNTVEGEPSEEQNTGNAIHAWKCNHMAFSNNKVKGHRDGIYLEFVTDSRVEHNFCHNNIRYGLHFMFSHNNAYAYNRFHDNGAGVAVMYTRNVVMHHNHFEYNWGSAAYGLLLKDISDSKIEYNTFENNTAGVYLEGSSRIQFRRNTLENNGWALRLQANCSDNVFEKNNFLANTFDVATNGGTVLNSFTGNYWDQYPGYDLNRDGVGDVPYHPVSLYAMIVERIPAGLMFLHSFVVRLIDESEKVFPTLTPSELKDNQPRLKPLRP